MNRLFRSLALVSALGSATRCSSTETGNPGKTTTLTLLTKSALPDHAMVHDSTSELNVSSLWCSLRDIELTRCADGTSLVLHGDWVVDAAAPGSAFSVAIPTGSYCSVRLNFGLASSAPDGAPEGLRAASVWVTGARRDGVAFRVRSTSLTSLSLGNGGYPLALGPSALLAVDVSTLLSGVNIETRVANAANEVDIDSMASVDLIQTFDANLTRAVTLHDDSNGNAQLDPNELQPIAHP